MTDGKNHSISGQRAEGKVARGFSKGSLVGSLPGLSSVIRGKSSRSETVVARAVNPFFDKVVMKGL